MTVDVCQLVLNILKGAGINAWPALPEESKNPATNKLVRPIVQVEEAGGAPNRDANRLNKQDLQIDIWGNSKKEAWNTMAQVRDLLIASRNLVADDGVVLVGAKVNLPSYLKDPSFPVGSRPGPRYVMVATVTAHA